MVPRRNDCLVNDIQPTFYIEKSPHSDIYANQQVKHDKQKTNIFFMTDKRGGIRLEKRAVKDWKKDVRPALYSKQKEFELLGYREISTEDIWRYLIEKVWKDSQEKHLYEVVQTIFHLPIYTYMDYVALESLVDVESEEALKASIQEVMEKEQQK